MCSGTIPTSRNHHVLGKARGAERRSGKFHGDVRAAGTGMLRFTRTELGEGNRDSLRKPIKKKYRSMEEAELAIDEFVLVSAAGTGRRRSSDPEPLLPPAPLAVSFGHSDETRAGAESLGCAGAKSALPSGPPRGPANCLPRRPGGKPVESPVR